MDIQLLKQLIENKNLDDRIIIFRMSEGDFIPVQYLDSIVKLKGLKVDYPDDIMSLINYTSNIFGDNEQDNNIKIYRTDEFNITDEKLISVKNLYIICKKVSEESQSLFADYIVDVPKLQSWQIKDYVYSIADGIAEDKLDNLIDICKGDIYRLDKELEKLDIFNKEEKKFVYDDFVNDGVFSDLSQYTIFNFTNCIIKKDIVGLLEIYKQIDKIDIEPIGLLTVLLNNFRNIILIQLGNNPTPESVGMSRGQFWAIKYSCGAYNKEQLMKIFELLSSIDKKIKMGLMPVEILIDYLVTHVLIIGLN